MMDSVSGTASGDTAINVNVVGPAEIRANLFADRLIESDQDRPGVQTAESELYRDFYPHF